MSSVVCPNCRFVLAGDNPPHSPVPALLESNAAPPDFQIPEIQTLIANTCSHIARIDGDVEHVRSVLDRLTRAHQHTHATPDQIPESLAVIFFRRKKSEISRLEAEIEQVRALLEQLLTDRWELHAFMKDHCAILSPVRRLFPELLSEVFLHCLSPWGQPPVQSPWLLGQICSGWRAVALSTPRLWSHVDVRVTATSVTPRGDALRTWIARSKACPLTVSIGFMHSPLWISHSTFDVVLSSSHRWQDLHLSYPTLSWPSQPFRAINAISGRVPLLRRLRIGGLDNSIPLVELPTDAFLTAPLLRVLELGCNVLVRLSALKIPWAQLTHFENENASVEDWLEILYMCPNLVQCTLKCTHQGILRPHASLPHSVRHQQLRRLHITQGGLRVGHLFDHLDLPALRELDIESIESWPQTQFISFLRRTLGSVERLFLRRVSFTGDELIECLSETPALNQLYIQEHIDSGPSSIPSSRIFTDQVLRRLTSDMVPKLRSISFCGPAFSDNIFAIMVQSRWKRRPGYGRARNWVPGRVHLQSVRLVLGREIGSLALQRLERFRREGLNVQIYDDVDSSYRD
jgi:hypothetical protein